MSAQPCGCDVEEGYICREHTEIRERSAVVENVALSTGSPFQPTTQVEQTVQAVLSNLLALWQADVNLACDLRKEVERLQAAKIAEHNEAVFWRNDRRHIAEVLAAFYRAPLSISAVQPILRLAEELNPSLKTRA